MATKALVTSLTSSPTTVPLLCPLCLLWVFFCSLNSGTVLLYSHDTENSCSSQMSAGKHLRLLKSHFVNKASKTLPTPTLHSFF